MKNKKALRIAIVDTIQDHIGPFINLIAKDFSPRFVDDDPDFIIHSCFSRNVLRYDGVRVMVLGENLIPDFNISDYAFGSPDINFGDRYYRLPQYRLYADYEHLLKIGSAMDEQAPRRRFCTCVVSNANRNPIFFEVYRALGVYKSISSGGRWNNNVGGPVDDKNNFLKTGKFSLVFENSIGDGYVTEKIMQAINAGAIPIYWGAPNVGNDFNTERMINCNDYGSVEEIVRRVIEIDQDDNLYKTMIRMPVFPQGLEPLVNREEYIRRNIRATFSQSRDNAYRRNREVWGMKYQKDMLLAFHMPQLQAGKILRQKVRSFFNR